MPQHLATFSDIQGGRPILYYAVRDNLLNDATQAGVWGVSKSIEVDLPAITRADGNGEIYTDAMEIKIKFVALQDNYAAIKRAILLANALQTVVAQFDLDYYNFVKPYDLGMEVMLDVTETEISLTLNYHGKCRPSEWDTILAAATGLITGSTGGVSISALTSEAFNDAEYGIPGIEGIYIGTTGNIATDDELGVKEAAGSKLQITIAKMGDTLRLQPITKRVEIKNTIAVFENRYTSMQRLTARRNTEQIITWVLANGTTLVFHHCTKIAPGFKINDTTGLMEIRQEGGTWLDPINATPTNIVFNDGTSTITFNKQGAIGA